ncbi:CGNR zinc finger domain-containing protein [Nocardia sp. NBC_00565]|uniref:CGNR zinc finger domain-containing protein n=1 Tax=Nocardia sp. NBC_00565 TaxID=2975993 RepID=UPI002E7FD641|nr:CGNR zinc finger domain-containing protein [Nocardia sp. NBC_00565]WUC00400.1 CGNR zinc finger domain-containing protein [Nocardia sp. NBC_00565]
MTTEDKLAFRFDCGATWLNLLATTGRRFSANPVERLATPERLTDWLERVDLAPQRTPDDDDLRRVWQLRETLRALALATVDRQPPPAAAVAELAAFVADHPDPIRLAADERLRREPPATVDDALARIAREAVGQLTGAERTALKSCPEHDCRGVFLDPQDRRRWCPAPACASRGRVRAHRARRSAEVADQAR